MIRKKRVRYIFINKTAYAIMRNLKIKEKVIDDERFVTPPDPENICVTLLYYIMK